MENKNKFTPGPMMETEKETIIWPTMIVCNWLSGIIYVWDRESQEWLPVNDNELKKKVVDRL